jgi:hypothetical protein
VETLVPPVNPAVQESVFATAAWCKINTVPSSLKRMMVPLLFSPNPAAYTQAQIVSSFEPASTSADGLTAFEVVPLNQMLPSPLADDGANRTLKQVSPRSLRDEKKCGLFMDNSNPDE